jgi:hypothetical protein
LIYDVSEGNRLVPSLKLFEAKHGGTCLTPSTLNLQPSTGLSLRIKDVDLDRLRVTVRAGKGDKDRMTVLPEKLVERLRAHRDRVRELYALIRLKP